MGSSTFDIPISKKYSTKPWNVNVNEIDTSLLGFDFWLRPQIWDYDIIQRNEFDELTLKLVHTNLSLKEPEI